MCGWWGAGWGQGSSGGEEAKVQVAWQLSQVCPVDMGTEFLNLASDSTPLHFKQTV